MKKAHTDSTNCIGDIRDHILRNINMFPKHILINSNIDNWIWFWRRSLFFLTSFFCIPAGNGHHTVPRIKSYLRKGRESRFNQNVWVFFMKRRILQNSCGGLRSRRWRSRKLPPTGFRDGIKGVFIKCIGVNTGGSTGLMDQKASQRFRITDLFIVGLSFSSLGEIYIYIFQRVKTYLISHHHPFEYWNTAIWYLTRGVFHTMNAHGMCIHGMKWSDNVFLVASNTL